MRLLSFLIKYNIFIASCAVAFYLFYSFLFTTVSSVNIIFIFSGTIAIYNFLQSKHNKLTVLAFMTAICLTPWVQHIETYLIGFFLTIAYKYKLRAVPILKPAVIAITWVLLLDIMSLSKHPFVLLEAFIFISALTIPFDIKDEKEDNKIETIAKMIGKDNSKLLSCVLLILSLILRLVYVTPDSHYLMPALFISFIYLIKKSEFTTLVKTHIVSDGLIIMQLFYFLNLYSA